MTKYFEIDSPALKHAGELASDYKLKNQGITYLDRVYWNLPVPALYEEAVFRVEGHVAHQGPFVVSTGKWSARAAQDKTAPKKEEFNWAESGQQGDEWSA